MASRTAYIENAVPKFKVKLLKKNSGVKQGKLRQGFKITLRGGFLFAPSNLYIFFEYGKPYLLVSSQRLIKLLSLVT